jgi:hypothetical protein
VLLGITGGNDDVSFGSITGPEDDIDPPYGKRDYFAVEFGITVSNFVEQYQLDGVELYDTKAAKYPINPDTYPYPDGRFEGDDFDKYEGDPHSNMYQWGYAFGDDPGGTGGGKQLAYLTKKIREAPNGYMSDKETTLIFIREKNYGAYVAPEAIVFDFRDSYINSYLSYEYHVFGSSRGTMDHETEIIPIPVGGSSIYTLDYSQYAPLAIDLTTVTPPIYDEGGDDIGGFSDLFIEYPKREFAQSRYYGLIFYNGLMAASDEGSRFKDTRPGSPTNGQMLTQADIFSITSEKIMMQKVTREPGRGNHLTF